MTIKDDDKWHEYVYDLRTIREERDDNIYHQPICQDAGSIREIQFYSWTGPGTHTFHFNKIQPVPKADPYNKYREGVVKRHIVCSGRYLSGMWLKEFEPWIDCPPLDFTSFYDKQVFAILNHTRVFRPPLIRSAKGVQSDDARTYIPWLSEQEVHGGGENPLLRGGIAMATFATEYLVKGDPSSLKYAELLLDYFETCEVRTISGNPTGFFLRCHHLNYKDEIELHASTDEIVGMVLGLYYLFLATEDHRPSTSNRVAELMQRLGIDLKRNAFLLVPPEDKVQRAPGETVHPLFQGLHQGSSGLFFFQWALEQAFQRVTGNRFTPNLSDYRRVSKRLFEIFKGQRAQSKDGPCLLVAKNRLYLAWSGGGDERLLQLMSTADGVHWDPKDPDPLKGERSDHSPSLAYFNGKFYIAWTGTDHYHHVNVMSTADGKNWGNKKTFTTSPGPATSKDGPCLLVAKNRLYLAWSGGGHKRLLQLMSKAYGDDWDPKDEDPLKGERSDHSPSLAYFNGKFYIAWTGTDHYHHVNVMSSEDGVHWGNKKTFTTSPGPATSKDGPCLLVAKNRLYLAWSGGGDERLLQLMSTADGDDWDPKDEDPLKGERSDHSPSLAYFNGKFYIAWTGTDKPDYHVNVMSSDGNAWSNKHTCEFAPPNDIYGIMYIWLKQGRIDPAVESKWNDAIQDRYHISFWKNIATLGLAMVFEIFLPTSGLPIGIATRLAEEISEASFIESNRDPFIRYLTTISFYTTLAYLGSTGNWFNLALLRHTFHYALDERILIRTEARKVAAEASELTKVIICGDRWRARDNPDDDFYAAVIAKGLLNRYANVEYMDRVNQAIEARERMWDELPAGEPEEVRNGEWTAPVRWHNSDDLTSVTAKIGTDFCWEKHKGKKRILASGRGAHTSVTGITNDTLANKLSEGIDAIFEGGGLDFMFPRVLMSYWLNEPLDFADHGVPPLRAITCLPFRSSGGLQKDLCGAIPEAVERGEKEQRSDLLKRLAEMEARKKWEDIFRFIYMAAVTEHYVDRGPDVRNKAEDALVERGSEAVEPLIEALKDEDKKMRECAARTLGRIGDVRAWDALTYVSNNDNNPVVRSIAKNALKNFK